MLWEHALIDRPLPGFIRATAGARDASCGHASARPDAVGTSPFPCPWGFADDHPFRRFLAGASAHRATPL